MDDGRLMKRVALALVGGVFAGAIVRLTTYFIPAKVPVPAMSVLLVGWSVLGIAEVALFAAGAWMLSSASSDRSGARLLQAAGITWALSALLGAVRLIARYQAATLTFTPSFNILASLVLFVLAVVLFVLGLQRTKLIASWVPLTFAGLLASTTAASMAFQPAGHVLIAALGMPRPAFDPGDFAQAPVMLAAIAHAIGWTALAVLLLRRSGPSQAVHG